MSDCRGQEGDSEMTRKYKEEAVIIRQEEIAPDIYSMWLHTDHIAQEALPGQFIGVYCRDGSRLLPRPISLCEIDREDQAVRIVYRVAGKGTDEFSYMRTGMPLFVIGPLGNGFLLQQKKAFLIGGGIGIPPMLQLAKELSCEKEIILGYPNKETFLSDQFALYGEVHIATENGSVGTKGNVLDVIREKQLQADVVYACGPMPMLKALKAYANEHEIECYISLEEHMACGVGACLGCVCKSVHKDSHSKVRNKRICTEGPVFDAREVDI
jgi:dihydroorotate dehydrogenase electron transfer subunit